MLMNAIMCRFAGIIGAMIIWKQHRAYGNGTILHGQSALLKPHFSWISRTSFERLLRSVKTEEDAPTHNTIWARKWNKSEKRNDNIIQSSKNQWASFLEKKWYFTYLEIEKDLKKDAKVHFFSRKISLLQDQWENNFYLHNIGIKSKWIMIG